MNVLWRVRFACDHAIKAFHNFLLNKSVRWYNLPHPEYRQYRYPSPASEPIFHTHNNVDYKTSYRESTHFIRHEDEKVVEYTHIYMRDPLGETVEQKLAKFELLKQSSNNTPQAIEEAKKKYQLKVGESVDVRVHQDDFDVPQLNTREAISQYVRQEFKDIKQMNLKEAYTDTLEDFYRPHFYIMRNYDYSCDDPVQRQVKVELEYQLEQQMEDRKKAGEMTMFKGDPNFWLILDNSFPPESIKQVQATVRDTVSLLDQKYLETSKNRVGDHKEETLKFPITSQFID